MIYGVYRTPTMMEIFSHNYFEMKEKNYLVYEKKGDNFSVIPHSGEWGIRTRGPFDKSTVFKTAAIDHSANSPPRKYELQLALQNLIYLFFNNSL